MSELTDILIHNPDCAVREIGDGLAILAPGESAAHSIEEVGAFIWNHIDGKQNLETILAAIVNEYEVEEDRARRDLLEFIDELLKAGLLKAA